MAREGNTLVAGPAQVMGRGDAGNDEKSPGAHDGRASRSSAHIQVDELRPADGNRASQRLRQPLPIRCARRPTSSRSEGTSNRNRSASTRGVPRRSEHARASQAGEHDRTRRRIVDTLYPELSNGPAWPVGRGDRTCRSARDAPGRDYALLDVQDDRRARTFRRACRLALRRRLAAHVSVASRLPVGRPTAVHARRRGRRGDHPGRATRPREPQDRDGRIRRGLELL